MDKLKELLPRLSEEEKLELLKFIYSFEENESRLLEHISWKKHRNSTISFRNINTRYCLQFIRLDRDKKYNQWLFLGAFEICGVISFDDGHQVYDFKKMDLFNQYSER